MYLLLKQILKRITSRPIHLCSLENTPLLHFNFRWSLIASVNNEKTISQFLEIYILEKNHNTSYSLYDLIS